MAHTGKVRDTKSRMLEIYGINCWMGYTVDRGNPFTFHHIHEQRKGGKVSIDNGAILTKYAHQDLNQLDMHKKCLYNALNELFILLNETKTPPTIEYYREINKILLLADKVIDLSYYCNLHPDYGMLSEALEKSRELQKQNDDGYLLIDGVYMPVSYGVRSIDYVKEVPEELFNIPLEYKGKMKKKNRNRKIYSYI